MPSSGVSDKFHDCERGASALGDEGNLGCRLDDEGAANCQQQVALPGDVRPASNTRRQRLAEQDCRSAERAAAHDAIGHHIPIDLALMHNCRVPPAVAGKALDLPGGAVQLKYAVRRYARVLMQTVDVLRDDAR